MRNIVGWGSWVCAFAACACSAGAHRGDDSAAIGVRSAALEPLVGPEIGTDAPALVQTDLGHNPVVASDGNGFLAVQEVDSHIRAVRVDAAGKVLDATWLNFAEGTEAQYYPSVAFGGGHYLVTWSAFDAQSTVRGRFVRPDGTLEGTSAFTLTTGQGLYPSVGWTGSKFLVSWLGLGDSDSAVAVAAFDSNGNKIANSEHTVSNPGSIAYPRIAVGSNRALITWEKYTHSDEAGDIGRIYGALVDTSGTPAGAGEFALSNSPSSEVTASVAAAGSHFLVVWNTQDDPTSIFGSSISDTGAFDNEDVTISRSTENVGLSSVAFNGTNYLVAWTDGRDQQSIYGTPVSTTGVVLGSADLKLATGSPLYVGFASDRTALAWSGSKYLLSFLGHGIEGSLIGGDLQIQNGQIGLTAVANSQSYPRLAYDGSNYVVEWTDERDSSTDMSVRAVRIDAGGHVLDANGIVLSTAESTAFSTSIASTGNGSSLSVWIGISSGNFRRTLTSNGSLGALAPFSDQRLDSTPALAGNGNGYLAVYTTGDSSNGAVFGRLLDATGSGGSDFRIDSSTLNTGATAFRAAGGGYLVTYSQSGTRLIPVSSTGQLGASLELSTSTSITAAATGGNKTLVAWTDTNDTQIRARFFENGALTSNTLVLSESSLGWGAALSWDGSGYFAIWETPDHHLDGRSIGTDGTLGPVSTLVNEEAYAPVSDSNGQGQVLVSYTKYGESFRSRRIVSRLIGSVVDGGGGSGGSGGSAGATGGAVGSAGAAGTASGVSGSGGVAGTPGSGTAGSGTAGTTTGSAGSGTGGGNQPPVVINCSITQVGERGTEHGAMFGVGSLLAAVASAFARRRRRERAQRSR